MRKRLIALLSLAGLASSSTPGTSQAVKDSSAGPETKNESQVKGDKANQENAAVQDDVSKKMRKAGGEQKANQDVVTEKVGPDRNVQVKYSKRAKVTAERNATTDAKYNKKFIKASAEANAGKTQATAKLTTADAASKDAAKMTKATTENSATHEFTIKKAKTFTGESNAVTNEAGKKYHKAGKEQHDALTVKQKATVDAGAGKAKFEKNAAETKAAQENLEKKADKATPK
jgi:hypothetical protein